MKRDSKTLMIIGVLLVVGAVVLAGCGGGGGGGGDTPNLPAAFDLVSPANNATKIVFSSPTFTWQSSSNVTFYKLQISTNSSFTALAYENAHIASNVTSVVTATLLAIGTKYYWRVLAINAAGGTTNSTSNFSFTTQSGDPVWSAAGTSLGAGFDTAYGLAKDSSALYAVGYDTLPGHKQWRIEKRSIADGSLSAGFGIGGIMTGVTTTESAATAIAIDLNNMYVVGYEVSAGTNYARWRIEKRSLGNGTLVTVVTSTTGTSDAVANAIALDTANDAMYIAGYDTVLGSTDHEWRIEKRKLSTGETVTVINRRVGVAGGDDEAYGIAVDVNNANLIYVVGFDSFDGTNTSSWRMEKIDISTGASLTFFRTNGSTCAGDDAVPYAIRADTNSIYIAGYDTVNSNCSTTTNAFLEWRIEKRNLNDLLHSAFSVTTDLSASSADAVPNALAIDDTYIYAAGYDTNAALNPEQWRIEKRDITTGALVPVFGTNGVVNLTPSDEAWAIVYDTDYLYVSGDKWKFEKLVK